MMIGIFRERRGVVEYKFEVLEGGKKVRVEVIGIYPPPVLDVVRYTLGPISKTRPMALVEDARALDWGPEVHRACCSEVVYTPHHPPASLFSPKLDEWRNFDRNFLVSQLAPGKPLDLVLPYLERGAYLELVREVGGVVPLVLQRFVSSDRNEALVREAILTRRLTDRMKCASKVWMNDADLDEIGLSDPKIQEQLLRMKEAGQIVVASGEGGAKTIALGWAAAQVPLGDPHQVVYEEFRLPAQYPAPKRGKVDPSLPSDFFIDRRQLSTALFAAPPSPPTCDMQEVKTAAKLHEWVTAAFPKQQQNVIFVSDRGDIFPRGFSICEVLVSLSQPLGPWAGKNAVVRASFHAPGRSRLSSNGGAREFTVDNLVLYPLATYVHALRYEQLALVSPDTGLKECGCALVAIVSGQTEPRWVRLVQKYAKLGAECKFIRYSV